MDLRKFSTPTIIGLLALNSYLLINQDKPQIPAQPISEIDPAVLAMLENGIESPVADAVVTDSRIPLEVRTALQAMSANINEIRLTQKKIQKSLASLDNGQGNVFVARPGDQLRDKVVENSIENMEAYSQATRVLDGLVGVSQLNGELLVDWNVAIPQLSNRQKAELRNRISEGIHSGDIDPEVVSMLPM